MNGRNAEGGGGERRNSLYRIPHIRSSKIFLILHPEKPGAHIDGLLGTQIELSCSHHTPTDRFNDIAGV